MFVKHRKDIYHIPTDSLSTPTISQIAEYQKAYRECGGVLTDVKHLTYRFAQSTHQMCRHAHSASRKQPVRDMKPAVSRHGKGSSALRNGLYRTAIEPFSHNGRGSSAVPKSLFRKSGDAVPEA